MANSGNQSISQADMKTISDGVLDGLRTVDQLPDNVRSSLMNYWGSMGVNVNDMGSAVTQSQIQQLKQQRQDQEGLGNAFLNSPIFKPVEWLGSKIYKVYSDAISPVLSTGLMAAHDMIYGMPNWSKGQSELEELGHVWDYSHNISPGQSLWMLGLNNKELKDRGLDWKDLSMDADAQRAGTFHGTPTVDDPFGTKTRAQQYFGSGASKWVSGAVDLAVSWYADPGVLAGKGIGAAKASLVTREVTPQINHLSSIAERAGDLDPKVANKMAWDSLSKSSPFQGLTDSIWKINQANPDGASAAIARKVPAVAQSANTPAVASLLGQATSKEDVANILRITLGDDVANETLKLKNEELAYQIGEITKQKSDLGLYYDSLTPEEKLGVYGQGVQERIDKRSQQLADLDKTKRIVSDKIEAFGTMDALHYNKFVTPAGMKANDIFEASRSYTPFQGNNKVTAAVNNIYSLSLGGLVKLAHAYGDIKPTHYIDVNDQNSHLQLNASLLEVKGLSNDARDMYVSKYLNTPVESRTLALQQIENSVARNIVARYNEKTGSDVSQEVADSLYKEIASRRQAAQANMNQQSFSGARVPDPENPGLSLRVDEVTPDGGALVTTPVLKSQMANNHVMMDFKLYQKAISQEGKFWQLSASKLGDGWQTAVGLGDYVNRVWKFGQLFRLGYSPRMLMADDAMSQFARFGATSAMARGIAGGKYTWQALRRAFTPEGSLDAALVSRTHLEFDINDLEEAQNGLRQQLMRAKNEGRDADVEALQSQIDGNADMLASHRKAYADMDALVKGGAGMRHVQLGRQIFDAPFGGAQGSLFKDLNAGEKNVDNMMGALTDSYLNRMRRMNWEMLSPAKHGEANHMQAWLRVINQQIANDPLAVKYLRTGDKDAALRWLGSPEGVAYSRDNALSKHLPNDQVVDRVAALVDEVVNPAFPGGDAIRAAAARGEVTKDMLQQVPQGVRPLVNGQALSYARGSHSAFALLDKAMDNYFKYAAQLPGQFLLRNPLFAQRYQVHIRDLMDRMGKADDELIPHDLQMQVQSAARQKALQDVKKNTFTMDYESKMSHALRQFGSFFGAQQESWNRWARIISDKPDILARVPQVYGAPNRAGLEYDQNGQPIDGEGYSRDPVTGERKLVRYADRQIRIQIPDYLGGKEFKKFFGLDPKAAATIPMNTFVMVLSHGDGPNPVGSGPIVQIAANQIPFTGLDANGNPSMADFYQRFGVLPFGAQPMDFGHALETFLPTWARKALADQGDISETHNQNMWTIMQAENYKYREGLRHDAPTWKEISDRAHMQTWFKVLSGFAVPFSVGSQDPYQFFRDQHRQMMQRDPQNGDQQFYDKYGDSAYIFGKSLVKNNSGLQPTQNGIKMSKYYQDLIDKVGPEWAGVIVGSEGDGVYSNGAFYYLKTHGAAPGAGPAMKLMTPREAMDAYNVDRGWKQYTGYMNGLYAQLFQRGLTTFSDAGAEDLKAQKDALIKVLTSQRLPAGVLSAEESQAVGTPAIPDAHTPMKDNELYNAAWAKAFQTQDKSKYDQNAAAMRIITSDPELWAKAQVKDANGAIMRGDIYTMKTYLAYRDSFQQALILRKEAGGSDSPTAASNADLKGQWDAMVTSLIQNDLQFSNLFLRKFSHDMGYNQDTAVQEQNLGQLQPFQDVGSPGQGDIFQQMSGA